LSFPCNYFENFNLQLEYVVFNLKIQKMVKVRFVILAMFGFLFTEMAGLNAQSLMIEMKNGILNEAEIGSIQKLSYSVNDLLVSLKNGTINSYGLSAIQKLYFDESTTFVDQVLDKDSSILLYPNPAAGTITVLGMPNGEGFVSVYRPDGQMMLSEPVSSEMITLNITSLNSGIYFVLAKGFTSKFIKL